jgi:hemerythrin superfamily protein
MARKTTKSSNAGHDAIALLTQDHREVEKLYKQFAKAKKADDERMKADVVRQICTALTAHAEIEEEIFYPAVREAIEQEDIMDEATVEHGEIKRLVEELEQSRLGDHLYDAKVTVLIEYVKHHVQEEEGTMFPKVKRAKLDLEELGQQMAARKQKIMTEAEAA